MGEQVPRFLEGINIPASGVPPTTEDVLRIYDEFRGSEHYAQMERDQERFRELRRRSMQGRALTEQEEQELFLITIRLQEGYYQEQFLKTKLRERELSPEDQQALIVFADNLHVKSLSKQQRLFYDIMRRKVLLERQINPNQPLELIFSPPPSTPINIQQAIDGLELIPPEERNELKARYTYAENITDALGLAQTYQRLVKKQQRSSQKPNQN